MSIYIIAKIVWLPRLFDFLEDKPEMLRAENRGEDNSYIPKTGNNRINN